MKPGSEIVSYTPTKAALAGLSAKYKGLVFDVTTSKGMTEAKAAKKDLAVHRITLEKARVTEKAEALAYGRYVDSEATKIADELAALEDPITAQIEVETKRELRAREEAVRLEAERLAKEEADRKAAEEAKLAAERAELARQRAELDAKQKAQANAERDARLKLELDERVSRAKIEEQERAARAVVEEANRQAKALRDAEELRRKQAQAEEDARQQAERDRLAAILRAEAEARLKVEAEAEAKAKAERDAEEARVREVRRKVAEKADARTMIELFKRRFGHLPEYAGVIKAIDECLEPA